jgi:hypothetical protein
MWGEAKGLLADNLFFGSERELRQFQRTSSIAAKLQLLKTWVESREAHTVIVDTANPVFRGKESPDKDTDVGAFFDSFESILCSLHICVRHNHRHRPDDLAGDPASHVRGSSEWIGRPDVMLEMKRTDKRLNKAVLTVTKFRYGSKPEPIDLWFDAEKMILISYPPLAHLLRDGPRTRQELVEDFSKRFNVEERKAAVMIAEGVAEGWVTETMQKHEKIFALDLKEAKKTAWFLRFQHYVGE